MQSIYSSVLGSSSCCCCARALTSISSGFYYHFDSMLSGLISNLHTSPKAYLASFLAYALSTLFDVDPKLIESNLLSDAKIVLRNVQLKPRVTFLNHKSADPRVLVGQVEEVWLAWTWGGADNGTTSFVHETLLTIQGAQFRIKKATREEQEAATKQEQDIRHQGRERATSLSPEHEPATPENKTWGDDIGDYVDHYIQQIIDALRLEFTNSELTIETEDDNIQHFCKQKVIIQAKAVRVQSLGREKKKMMDEESDVECSPPILSFKQRISFDSLSAHVAEIHGNDEICSTIETLPLLDSFSFAATIKQLSGKRFVGGFTSGFEIVGESFSEKDDSSIVLHAGTIQIIVLTRIIEMLLWKHDGHHHDSKRDEDSTRSSLGKENAAPEVWGGTTITLPLPSMSLSLPNGSYVHMPNCMLRYVTDGTEFLFQSSEGIFIDESPVLQLQDQMRWRIDLVSREFGLDYGDVIENDKFYDAKGSSEEQEWTTPRPLATFRWQWREIKDLIEGIRQFILSIEKGREHW